MTLGAKIRQVLGTDFATYAGATYVTPERNIDTVHFNGTTGTALLQCRIPEIQYKRFNQSLVLTTMNAATAQILIRIPRQTLNTTEPRWPDYEALIVAYLKSLTFPLTVGTGDPDRVDMISIDRVATQDSQSAASFEDIQITAHVLFTIL